MMFRGKKKATSATGQSLAAKEKNLPVSTDLPVLKEKTARAKEKSARSVVSWKVHAVAGYSVIFLTFGVIGGWAAVTRLDRGVVVPAKVYGEPKIVDHFEGGMVREILVKEGQSVKEGDVLVRLNPIQSRATAELYRNQLDSVLILEARLRAEQNGEDHIDLPTELLDRQSDPAVVALLADQIKQMKERRASLDGQIGLLDSKVLQYQTEIEGVMAEKKSGEGQIQLIEQELVGLRILRDQDLIPVSRVLAQERERARLHGLIGRSVADIAKAQNGIAEAKLEIAQLGQKFQEDVSTQIVDTRQKISDLRQKTTVTQDVLSRLEVRAPQSGVVQELGVHTIGQSIKPGEPMMKIVPSFSDLKIYAEFPPTELENVHAGLAAEVKFPSFHSRLIPTIIGTLDFVSRDELSDPTNKQSYFRGIISVAKLNLPDEIRNHLEAGMPAEVIVATGERTALDYMVSPFFEAMGKAFKER